MATLAPSNPLNYIWKRTNTGNSWLKHVLLREKLKATKKLFRRNLLAHYGCVNAIEFTNDGEFLVSGGDDRRALVWRVDQALEGTCKPQEMDAEHSSNIFCLGVSGCNTKLFSAGNDEQTYVHDFPTGKLLNVFLHDDPIHGLSAHPTCESIFATACGGGQIRIHDIRQNNQSDPMCLACYPSPCHSVMFNPVEPRYVVSASSKQGLGLWDVRRPRKVVLRYGGNYDTQNCMNVRFNSSGKHIIALRRRRAAVLYAVHSPIELCEFDHQGYYNSCTMKSCCFAGEDDNYVISGSDDFNVYIWKIPPVELSVDRVNSAWLVLRGHRSIVNQVRFNSPKCLIASSGVEKLVKLWSPFSIPSSNDSIDAGVEESQRQVYTHEEYINLVLNSGQFMSHDYSQKSTTEDPCMMAFFDSLILRDTKGWSSDELSLASDEIQSSPLQSGYLLVSDQMSARNGTDSSESESVEGLPVDSADKASEELAQKGQSSGKRSHSHSTDEDVEMITEWDNSQQKRRKRRAGCYKPLSLLPAYRDSDTNATTSSAVPSTSSNGVNSGHISMSEDKTSSSPTKEFRLRRRHKDPYSTTDSDSD